MASKFEAIISDVGMQTGLKVRGLAAFGSYRGYLVCLHALPATSGFNLLVAFPKEEDSHLVQSRIDAKTLLKGINATGQATVEPGILGIGISSKWKAPDASQLRSFLDEVVGILGSTTEKYDDSCEKCEASGSEVILINGTPNQFCRTCIQELREAVDGAQRELESTKPNYKRGVVFALGAVLVSAIAWGLIAYIFEVMFFFAGFIVGLFVGYTLAYGAEKTDFGIIGLAVILTLFAVVLGEILYVTFILMGEGLSLALLPETFGFYLANSPGEFAAAVLTGLFGSGIVAYYLWSGSRQQGAPIEITA